jgi:hypothetical protein
MANELQKVKINTTTVDSMYSKFTARNVLAYQKEPSRSSDFTVKNDDIEASYIPTVSFTFALVTPNEFAWLMQIINSKGFFVEYYDYELQETVTRRMYMTESSLEQLYNYGTTYKGIVGFTATFVSKFGYVYTTESDANYTLANKYHYAQLHIQKTETRT